MFISKQGQELSTPDRPGSPIEDSSQRSARCSSASSSQTFEDDEFADPGKWVKREHFQQETILFNGKMRNFLFCKVAGCSKRYIDGTGNRHLKQHVNQHRLNGQAPVMANLEDREKAMMDFLLIHKLPFRLIECPLLRYASGTKISARNLQALLVDRLNTHLESMKIELSKSTTVALTTDVWYAQRKRPFACYTAHFIEKFKLRSLIIAFEEFVDSQTGCRLSELTEKVIDDFSLSSKLVSITRDDASVNNSMMTNLNWARNRDGMPTIHSVICFSHVVHLSVKDLLDGKGSVSQSDPYFKAVSAAQKLSHKIKRTPTLQRLVKEKCQEHNLKSVVIKIESRTRWNTQYESIRRILRLRTPLQDILSGFNSGLFREDEKIGNTPDGQSQWDLLDTVCRILKPINDATVQLSSAASPSLCCVTIAYDSLIRNLEKPAFAHIPFASRLKSLLEQRRKLVRSETALIAQALNPNFRCTWMNDEEKAKITELLQSEASMYQRPQDTETESNEENLWSLVAEDIAETHPSESCEVLKYLEMRNALNRGQNPVNVLCWWKTHQDRFPALFQVALRFLCIPATSVPSECVFSQAKDVIAPKRCRLSEQSVKASVILAKQLRDEEIKIQTRYKRPHSDLSDTDELCDFSSTDESDSDT